MTAIDALIEGLIDYAGMYPPAAVSLPTAAQNYLGYSRSKHGFALGRFVVDLLRLEQLHSIAGADISQYRLSITASTSADWDSLYRMIEGGVQVQTLEVKIEEPTEIERVVSRVPRGVTTYFELLVDPRCSEVLDAVCAAGARAKLRMGGITGHTFPSPDTTARVIQSLASRHLVFKATAGLHHPLRSSHPLTNGRESSVVLMHGFVNVFFAAALSYLGGNAEESSRVLSETDRKAWSVTPEAISWNTLRLDVERIREVRREFFVSFGSCSFIEAIEGLETLGWL